MPGKALSWLVPNTAKTTAFFSAEAAWATPVPKNRQREITRKATAPNHFLALIFSPALVKR
jgi:hypothetical protein